MGRPDYRRTYPGSSSSYESPQGATNYNGALHLVQEFFDIRNLGAEFSRVVSELTAEVVTEKLLSSRIRSTAG
jgi:hypothetical protein